MIPDPLALPSVLLRTGTAPKAAQPLGCQEREHLCIPSRPPCSLWGCQPCLYRRDKELRTKACHCPQSHRLQCIRMHPVLNYGNTVPLWPLSITSLQLLGLSGYLCPC